MKKNKKAAPLLPIVCKLVNNPEKHSAHIIIFSLINLLLDEEHPFVTDYFAYLNYFTIAQFTTFSNRIENKRNKELQVNQLHFIIFVSILHFTILLYKSKTIINHLKAKSTKALAEEFDNRNEGISNFCNNAFTELKADYKINHAMVAAYAKIEAYKIADDKYEVLDMS